jgi:hypothetical protein
MVVNIRIVAIAGASKITAMRFCWRFNPCFAMDGFFPRFFTLVNRLSAEATLLLRSIRLGIAAYLYCFTS